MNSELLQIIEFLEEEREIERETLFKMVEEALGTVIKKEFSDCEDVQVKMNREDGQISASAQFITVKKVTNPDTEKTIQEIKEFTPSPKLGETYAFPLPTDNIFSRIGAQAVKQAIGQKLREIEKSRVHEEYADQVGKLITGTVRSFDRGKTYIDFGRAEGVMPFNEKIKSEEYQNGDLITTILLDVNELHSGASLNVSRSHPDLVRRLFEREVTEIGDGTVIIKGLSREPGFRTKITVASDEFNVDPVGACVGMRGARVRAVMRELGREKIDIIKWDENIELLVAEAIKPAEIVKTEIDEENHTIIVHADSSQYSLAIGRRGQNARLVSQLVGWGIQVIEYQSEESSSMQNKMQNVIELFSSIPKIDQELAEELITSGYLSLDGLSEAELDDLVQVDGVDEALAKDIIQYAKEKIES